MSATGPFQKPENKPTLFGQIGVELGLFSAEQVEAALHAQKQQRLKGEEPARLGEILLERRDIELRGVQKILLEQQRRRDGSGKHPHVAGHIGPFEILSIVGVGGMGTVYKAKDRELQRIVALKVLSPRLAADDEFTARFEREVSATCSLSHPNIVSALGSATADGQRYMIMEYVEGRSLGKILKDQGRLVEKRALEIARDVASALDRAHLAGVVHRDVKPDNVLICQNGMAKLTDFGLAKLLREDDRLTQTGTAVGTPHYISPEQVAADRYIDHRADQYGLGAMLFHMVTGQVPFDGPNNNEIMLRHLEDAVPDVRELVPGIGNATRRVILKLMAKKSADRYDTTSQVVEDLERALRGESPLYAQPSRQSVRLQAPQRSGCAGILVLAIAVACFVIWCK